MDSTKLISLDARVASLERSAKAQLKIIAVVGSVVLSVGGWIDATYGSVIIKAFTG